ncbi:hypothetical protein J4727_08805 [Providencia rettgeri]|uniref:Uncharacterized protein n=1 Tax=Providencia rettgeri TaxID=587 RepID=A0A939SJ81_PRORE|nr:hypothetical protein [Providencia rettgeri]
MVVKFNDDEKVSLVGITLALSATFMGYWGRLKAAQVQQHLTGLVHLDYLLRVYSSICCLSWCFANH